MSLLSSLQERSLFPGKFINLTDLQVIALIYFDMRTKAVNFYSAYRIKEARDFQFSISSRVLWGLLEKNKQTNSHWDADGYTLRRESSS